MKIRLLLSLFFPFALAAQTDTVRLVKAFNYHPIIANTQLGSIPYWKLCDSAGIYTREACTVLSYSLSYFGKRGNTDIKIYGNTIPDSICTEIGVYGLNNWIIFTNIRAIVHDTYKVVYLTPMNLLPVKNEN